LNHIVIYFSFLTQVVSLPSLNHASFMTGLFSWHSLQIIIWTISFINNSYGNRWSKFPGMTYVIQGLVFVSCVTIFLGRALNINFVLTRSEEYNAALMICTSMLLKLKSKIWILQLK